MERWAGPRVPRRGVWALSGWRDRDQGRYLLGRATTLGSIFRPTTLPGALKEKKREESARGGTGCGYPSRILPQKMSLTWGGARRGLDQQASPAAGSGGTLGGRDAVINPCRATQRAQNRAPPWSFAPHLSPPPGPASLQPVASIHS